MEKDFTDGGVVEFRAHAGAVWIQGVQDRPAACIDDHAISAPRNGWGGVRRSAVLCRMCMNKKYPLAPRQFDKHTTFDKHMHSPSTALDVTLPCCFSH